MQTVHLRQSGVRTSQCALLGALTKPIDGYALKKLSTRWQKEFGEDRDQDLLFLVSVERILHMENFSGAQHISADAVPCQTTPTIPLSLGVVVPLFTVEKHRTPDYTLIAPNAADDTSLACTDRYTTRMYHATCSNKHYGRYTTRTLPVLHMLCKDVPHVYILSTSDTNLSTTELCLI